MHLVGYVSIILWEIVKSALFSFYYYWVFEFDPFSGIFRFFNRVSGKVDR